MQQRGAHVKVLIPRGAQSQADIEVDHDAHGGGDEHQPRSDRLWVLEALHGFVGDGDDDQDERDGVRQRGEDAGAVVPVRLALIGRTLGLGRGEPGQPQGDDVGQDMPGIGEQGQGVGEEAAGQLDEQDQGGQGKGGAELAADHAVRMVVGVLRH